MAARSDTASLTTRSRAVATLAREAAETEDPTTLERLETELGDLRSLAREQMQERFQQDFLELASKLEGNEALDQRDRELLAAIITGAASLYLKNEDGSDAWRQEIRRLAGTLEDIPDPDQDGVSGLLAYLQTQATVEETMRVVPDLRIFLQEGERLKRFKTATGSIDPEERRFLARLIGGNGRCGGIPVGRRRLGPPEGHDVRPQPHLERGPRGSGGDGPAGAGRTWRGRRGAREA